MQVYGSVNGCVSREETATDPRYAEITLETSMYPWLEYNDATFTTNFVHEDILSQLPFHIDQSQ